MRRLYVANQVCTRIRLANFQIFGEYAIGNGRCVSALVAVTKGVGCLTERRKRHALGPYSHVFPLFSPNLSAQFHQSSPISRVSATTH